MFTIREFYERYPDDDSCLEEIKNRKYSEWICGCGRAKLYRVRARPLYACACGKQVSPLVGTIFENTNVPLTAWFYVIYVMSQSKCGFSAANMQRHLGFSYATCWRMMMKVRELMVDERPLTGKIEADETYMRAKPWRTTRPLPYNGRAQTVFGMAERNGRARAMVLPTNSKKYLLGAIEDNVKDVDQFYTDGFPAYQDLGKKYDHYTVHHSKGEYVNGHIYTNNIENVWGGIKRGVYGVHRVVHPEYLQNYLTQYTWIYNVRFSSDPFLELLAQI